MSKLFDRSSAVEGELESESLVLMPMGASQFHAIEDPGCSARCVPPLMSSLHGRMMVPSPCALARRLRFFFRHS